MQGLSPATPPRPQPDLAQQIIKDPYNFDFLTLTAEGQERDLERGRLDHLRYSSSSSAPVLPSSGAQIPFEIGGEDFKIDLLFYDHEAQMFRCDRLKMAAFKPKYAGKMNF